MTPGHQLRSPKGEGAADIGAPLLGAEIGLSAGGHGPNEDVRADRKPPGPAKSAGEQERLIEAALPLPPGVKRHGNQEVRVGDRQALPPHFDQQIAEGSGKSSPPKELEGVQGLPQDTAIPRCRSRIAEHRRAATALIAAMPQMAGTCRRGDGPDESTEREPADTAPGWS